MAARTIGQEHVSAAGTAQGRQEVEALQGKTVQKVLERSPRKARRTRHLQAQVEEDQLNASSNQWNANHLSTFDAMRVDVFCGDLCRFLDLQLVSCDAMQ